MTALEKENQRLKEKCERQADLIERLTEQNGHLQYKMREVVRLSDQAFKILGQIRSE
jgi:predicted RNase H-like nuclease (RuvC/YqgF family)